MLKGEYMAEELEKWRYPRFFSDTIDENDRIIYMNDEDSKHIAQVLRMRKGDKAIICDKNGHDYLCELSSAAWCGENSTVPVKTLCFKTGRKKCR